MKEFELDISQGIFLFKKLQNPYAVLRIHVKLRPDVSDFFDNFLGDSYPNIRAMAGLTLRNLPSGVA